MAEIIVPFGGTADSVIALPTALALAQALDARVHVVHVVQVPSGPLSGTASALGAGHATAAVRSRIERALATVAEDMRAAGLQGTSAVIEAGDVPGALLDHALERESRMIVMAARPRSAIERALLGSVSDRLLREPGIPVVIVPVRGNPNDRSFARAAEVGSGLVGAALRVARPIRRILVPIDGSPHALRTLGILGPVARGADEVLLFHAVIPHALTGTVAPAAADDGRALKAYQREACDRLGGIAEQLRPTIPALRPVVVEGEDPATTIMSMARARHVELIAMCTRGDGGLKRAFVGSTAAEVLRNTRIPVLLVAQR